MNIDVLQEIYIKPYFYIQYFFEIFSVFAFSFFIPCLIGYIVSRFIVKREIIKRKNMFSNLNDIKDIKKNLQKSGIFFIIANILWVINLYLENLGILDKTELVKFLHYNGIDITVIFLICIIIMILVSFTYFMINYNRLDLFFGNRIPPINSINYFLFKVRMVLIVYFIVLGVISVIVAGYESNILYLLNYI